MLQVYSIYLSVYLSIYLSSYLSIYMHVCMYIWYICKLKLLYYIYIKFDSYISLSTFSSNIFFFDDLFLLTAWVQSNFFLPIMIKSIPMNSICLGWSFSLIFLNNDLWVSRSISEILKTRSIAKFSKVLLLIHVSHDYYHISKHCPLFRFANTLRFSGS